MPVEEAPDDAVADPHEVGCGQPRAVVKRQEDAEHRQGVWRHTGSAAITALAHWRLVVLVTLPTNKQSYKIDYLLWRRVEVTQCVHEI